MSGTVSSGPRWTGQFLQSRLVRHCCDFYIVLECIQQLQPLHCARRTRNSKLGWIWCSIITACDQCSMGGVLNIAGAIHTSLSLHQASALFNHNFSCDVALHVTIKPVWRSSTVALLLFWLLILCKSHDSLSVHLWHCLPCNYFSANCAVDVPNVWAHSHRCIPLAPSQGSPLHEHSVDMVISLPQYEFSAVLQWISNNPAAV